MTIRLLLAATALATLPGLALAMGCSGDHVKEEVAMSCAEGSVFDAETKSCVPEATS